LAKYGGPGSPSPKKKRSVFPQGKKKARCFESTNEKELSTLNWGGKKKKEKELCVHIFGKKKPSMTKEQTYFVILERKKKDPSKQVE